MSTSTRTTPEPTCPSLLDIPHPPHPPLAPPTSHLLTLPPELLLKILTYILTTPPDSTQLHPTPLTTTALHLAEGRANARDFFNMIRTCRFVYWWHREWIWNRKFVGGVEYAALWGCVWAGEVGGGGRGLVRRMMGGRLPFLKPLLTKLVGGWEPSQWPEWNMEEQVGINGDETNEFSFDPVAENGELKMINYPTEEEITYMKAEETVRLLQRYTGLMTLNPDAAPGWAKGGWIYNECLLPREKKKVRELVRKSLLGKRRSPALAAIFDTEGMREIEMIVRREMEAKMQAEENELLEVMEVKMK